MQEGNIPKSDRRLERVIRRMIVATLVVVPLAVFSKGPFAVFYPYTFPKAILFQIFVEMMAGVWIVLAVRNPHFRPQWCHPVVIGALIFFILTTISQIFSSNFLISFWSTQNRMTGLFHYIHIVLWFLVIHSTVKTHAQWRPLLTFSSITAAAVAGIGIVEWLVRNFQQIDSTLGNSILLATYLLLSSFLTLWRYQQSTTKSEKRVFLGIFFIIFIALVLAESRSAFLGLAAGLLLWGCLEFRRRGRWFSVLKSRQIMILSGVAVIVISAFVAISLQTGRFINLFSTTLADRFQLWQIGWKTFLEKSIMGWGFEQFSVPFSRMRDINTYPDLTDFWDDRTHNLFIDIMVSSGAVGLAGYLLLLAIIIYIILKYRITLSPFLAVFFTAYIVNGFFQPDQIIANILFFFVLAALAYFSEKESLHQKKLPTHHSNGTPIAIIAPPVVLVLLVMFLWGNVRPLFAEARLYKAMRIVPVDMADGLARFKAVFSSEQPYERDMRRNMAGVIIGIQAQTEKQKQEHYRLLSFVGEQIDLSLKRNADDLKIVLAGAFIQQQLVQYNLKNLARLKEYIDRVKILAPYLPELYELLGYYAVMQDDLDAAMRWYEQAEYYSYASSRKISIASSKAQVFARLGRWMEALEEIHRLSDYDASLPIGFLVNSARGALVNSRIPDEIISLTTRLVGNAPKSPFVLKAATIIFHQSKKTMERDRAFEKLKRLAPDIAQELRKELSLPAD